MKALIKELENRKWYLIGMHLYIFPPEPKFGDIIAFHEWYPIEVGFWKTFLFRIKTWTWKCEVMPEPEGTIISRHLKNM